MVSTFTPNIQIEQPARGDDVGTWDTPVNANMSLIDLVAGANTTINIGSGNVVLSAGQFRSAVLTFNSTLIANTTITFPTSFTKPYTVGHLCTGSGSFTLTLQTTAAGGQVIALPPGEFVGVYNDGTNLKFASGLHRVGEYFDYAGSSVPNWISGCTVQPYLLCNGSTVPAGYPVLTAMGITTLPDTRGRVRVALDAGVGRISSSVTSFQANTLFAGGGDQNMMSHTHANSLSDPGHVHVLASFDTNGSLGPGSNAWHFFPGNNINTNSATTGITLTNASAGSGGAQNIQPSIAHGITLLRAA